MRTAWEVLSQSFHRSAIRPYHLGSNSIPSVAFDENFMVEIRVTVGGFFIFCPSRFASSHPKG
jgi:hypothetical protein